MKSILTSFALLAATLLLLPPHAARAQASGTEIIVEAYIDGPSTFHLTPDGVYWTNGNNAKPGRWHKNDFPTYLNGAEWKPVWGKPSEERGPDKSEPHSGGLGTVEVNFRLIAVSQERGQTGREKRAPITAKREGAEFIVIIPDPEAQPRWYRFALRKH